MRLHLLMLCRDFPFVGVSCLFAQLFATLLNYICIIVVVFIIVVVVVVAVCIIKQLGLELNAKPVSYPGFLYAFPVWQHAT